MAEKFVPDNVTMLDTTGKTFNIREQYGQPIIKEVMQNALITQLGQYKDMNGPELTFDVFLNGVGAYWVGEGQRIQTTKPTWTQAKMKSHKLGVILPVTREYLGYKQADFFEFMKGPLAEAIYKKIDSATILGEDKPVGTEWVSIKEAAKNTGNLIEGDLTIDTYNELVDALNDEGIEPNAYISQVKNNSTLRNLVEFDGNNIARNVYENKTLDGVPVFNINKDLATDLPKGTIYAGDFNQVYYGIPYNMTFRISEDATLTTVQDDEGNDVNLFEREMVAMRVTFDFAYLLIDEKAVAGVAPAIAGEGDGI